MTAVPVCLIFDSDERHAKKLSTLCSDNGYRVVIKHTDDMGLASTAQALTENLDVDDIDIAFLDTSLGLSTLAALANETLPGAEVFAMAESDDSRMAEACARSGISHYFCKPFSNTHLSAVLDDIAKELQTPVSEPASSDVACALDQFGLMRGSSKPMRKLFRLLRKIGPTEATALIIGESGTGKELVAETLHTLSERVDEPYLTLNCSALAENLVESELFGHEKGSFSGAHKRHTGFFERADGGTLFLDEITEMPLDTQAKLLRVLESGEIRAVGATEDKMVDVRVVAATNRDPLQAVEDGQLREDLYYRLANVSVRVPPLRLRSGDIQGLARFFLMQLNEQHQTALTISDSALEHLSRYDWPGNVRQLRHAVEHAYIVSDSEIVEAALELGHQPEAASGESGTMPISVGISLADYERQIILENLKHNNGDKKATADVLGISLKTLYNRLREYDEAQEKAGHSGDP